MNKNRISLRRIALLLLFVAAIAAFIFLVAIPSQEAWSYARTLSGALTNARSVTLIEFQRDILGPELVFARVAASPQQIAALRSATGAWYAPIPPRRTACFSPHHRVEIVRADGSTLRFDVCFHCNNFTLGGPHAITMPKSWRGRLARYFTSVGMPPLEDYSALAKSHPDYHMIEEAWRDLDRQIEQSVTPQEYVKSRANPAPED
jgi:hypothetical protein